ncbi:MAG TPA: NAD-dependent epimerase/dehydratase family protein [Acidimicrobiia bacterium]|nr:NAD-dependent epimerase/dehydratase family protein [Acidimicrobiia bacterium]
MGKTLVTGGAGFIGTHLVRALLERGDELRLLLRRTTRADHLSELDFERATGDITDRRVVRRAMRGVDRVFHAAGRTSMRTADREAVFDANVRGARVVFEEALRAEVERVVHTSSVSAIGTAKRGATADEKTLFNLGHLGIAYVNSKHEAEMEGLRIAAHGLPVVFVNPTFVFGPDDPSRTSMGLIRRFLLGRIPAYVDGALNVVDVRDVADGHLLADAQGEVAERYILSGRNFTLDRLFADLSRISGAPRPVRIPVGAALAPVELAERLGLPAPTSRDEVRSGALWWTYRNTKARKELGFKPRPHEETLDDAVAWQIAELGDRVRRERGPRRIALGALGRAMRVVEGARPG